ncbi:extracellular solute-binding protein [Paenibacillus sp. SAF-054]|uniref:extracellular solute-binding protein n=1 Tax=unclassified Paenibacillus TaxID=185978 RepID=UPI003F81FF89
MSKRTRKPALFGVVLLLLALSLGGCTSGSDKDADGKDDKGPLKLSVMAGTFGSVPENTEIQKEWQKRMEAYIGRELDITWQYVPWGEYNDKFKLTLASGDLPDIMTNSGGDLAVQYGRQGIVLDIAKHLDQAPNYSKFLESTPYAKTSLYTPEGNMYFFGDGWSNTDNNEGSVYGSIYRFDIFKKHNIKIPETQDEFYEAAKKLKELYPDTYPVNSFGWPKTEEGFQYSNHTSAGIYWDGKQFTYGTISDSFRESLEFVNKLYREKLLDPEIITQSEDQMKQKMTTGKSFMIPMAWFGFADEFNSLTKGQMEWGGALLPNNPKYGKAWKMSSVEPGRIIKPYNGVLISAKAKNPELLVKMIDYQYSDEMIDLVNWGIEGKTYEIKDGKKQYLPEIMNAEIPSKALDPFGTGGDNRSGFVFTPQDFGSDVGKYKPMPFFAGGKYMNAISFNVTNEYGGKDSIAPMDRAPVIALTKEEQAMRNEIMTPIDTYVSEMVTKFIIGEKSFDEWDSFKNEITKLGDYESVVKLMNEKVAAAK